MGRKRKGDPMPPGVVVKGKKKPTPPPPPDVIKRFFFRTPSPNGLGVPKAPYTRMQNKEHKRPAPPYPKGLVPHKVKVTVRVELGKELLAQRQPGDRSTWKAFNIHTTGITKRGTFYLCMADPRVIQKLRDKGYKVPATDLLRVVMDDNPLLWIPNLEPYTWWYPQPDTNPTDPTPEPEA